jgi:GTP cyclohydrolase I
MDPDIFEDETFAPGLDGVVREMLELLGQDTERDGLLRTPARVARSLSFLTSGYHLDPREVVGSALFEAEYDEMVVVRDVELYSLCEHHMLPFFGRAHIAYLPGAKIVGLSKLARIVEVFARRLQVQERLTTEIANAINDILEPKGVGVVVEARHLCMMMRGVEKQNSFAVTSCMLGQFRTDARTRGEFLSLIEKIERP